MPDGGAGGCAVGNEEGGAAVEEVYGEEGGAAGDAVAAVVGHGWEGVGVWCGGAMGF